MNDFEGYEYFSVTVKIKLAYYNLKRLNSAVVTMLLSVREVWGSNTWLVKSGAVSPVDRHCNEVFSKRCFFPAVTFLCSGVAQAQSCGE